MSQPIPDPIFVVHSAAPQSIASTVAPALDLRASRIEEFLMARSLSQSSQKAYRQDLQAFLDWTQAPWAMVNPRLAAQFKEHLMREEKGQRSRSDATVRRILGTLKNFYGWMQRSRYVEFDPTIEIQLPKLIEPEAQNLPSGDVKKVVEAAAATSLPERNVALIAVLLHGLRASEVSALNMEDYDRTRLHIRKAKADSKGTVPLAGAGREALDRYLDWRKQQGDVLAPTSPLFLSHSRRNNGDRISYGAIRKTIDKLSEETGIDFHAHQFRHTFATNLVLEGMNPYHVMTLTRHKSQSSFRRYTKAADQQAAEAAFYETKRRKAGLPLE